MDNGTARRIGELIRERRRAEARIHAIDRHLAGIERSPEDLALEVADAEERGDWPLASRLRSRRLSERLRREEAPA